VTPGGPGGRGVGPGGDRPEGPDAQRRGADGSPGPAQAGADGSPGPEQAGADGARDGDGDDRRTGTPKRGRDRNGYVCEICGSPMIQRHCKILCLNCGYQRDCSDP